MPKQKIKILTISKNIELKNRIAKMYDGGAEIDKLTKIEEALTKIEIEKFDIIVMAGLSLDKSDLSYEEFFKSFTIKSPSSQLILLLEPENIPMALTALKAGTFQYAKLPVSDEELTILIRAALERRPQVVSGQQESMDAPKDRLGLMVGRSLPMQNAYQQILQAASTDIPILLLGETGTGKDLAAQMIYRHSKRFTASYIPVNLGALPSELVASELFGHEKGAFTSAVKQHKGVFEQAKNGTILLDEIDAVDEKVQISLLRLIEQKKFNRLGGRQSIRTDSRIIAASNADLMELVEKGLFRQDLFYRLDVFRIRIPPLREHPEDIPLLIEEFLSRFNKNFGKNIVRVSTECVNILESFDWPGNIREFKNVIQRAVLVCDGKEIKPEHLPPRFLSSKPSQPTITFEVGTPLDDVERQMVVRALEAAKNNRRKAAELLGISRRAIYNKLKKHDLK